MRSPSWSTASTATLCGTNRIRPRRSSPLVTRPMIRASISDASRQRDGERRARSRLRADREGAAHLRDDLARDEQAETGAADSAGHRCVQPVELLEDPLLLGRRNPGPFVAHVDADARGFVAHGHVYAVRLERVLDRILDEVDEHLAQQRLVAADR